MGTPAGDDYYLVNASAHHPARPSGTQNLQTLFSLDALAASVARVDANGNKILANKLNKTYKRQIFDLDLPGSPDIPKNKYIMGLLMAGMAHKDATEFNYDSIPDKVFKEAFSLQPGTLNGYVKYQPPSPTTASRKISKQSTPQPVVVLPRPSIFPGSNSYELVPNRAPTPEPEPQPLPVPSENGDESSDDGSRFKELERERKKKLRLKREAEAMYGDQKRRKYDVDEYSFLDD